MLMGDLLSASVDGGFLEMPDLCCSLLCLLPGRLRVVGWRLDIDGEFDSGSGRTLAACLTHASRTVMASLLV